MCSSGRTKTVRQLKNIRIMKIIYNNIIPFKGYKCVNLFGVLFVRKGCTMKEDDLNHEAIHSAQMKETLWVLFYLWYLIEWLVRLVQYGSWSAAYRNISFEREAFGGEDDLEYLDTREGYAWIEYLREED